MSTPNYTQPNTQYNYSNSDEQDRSLNPLLSDDDDDESSTAPASLSNSESGSSSRLVLQSLDDPVSNDRNMLFPDTARLATIASDTKPAALPQKTEVTSEITPLNKRVSLPQKIQIRFQSIGSTVQIEPRVYKITSTNQFSSVVQFLAKRLKKQQETRNPAAAANHSSEISRLPSIFCYIHNSFSPSNDEILSNLFANFAVNQELVVSYCENIAFG